MAVRSTTSLLSATLLASLVVTGCGDDTSTDVQDPRLVRAVSAGASHTCAITGDDTLYCWGWNPWGQLGVADLESRFEPAEVQIPGPVASVSAGRSHTCALTRDGTAYCWGQNAVGALGDGSNTSRSSPARVQGPGFTSVVAGWDHSCGLTPDGTAYCWGENSYGQVGTGTYGPGAYETEPVPVATQERFTQIAAGPGHTCGLTTEGTALCWGRNISGQVGNGTVSEAQPEPTPVQGESRYRAIQTGYAYTCALTPSGTAYCWGWNGYGQVGDGTRVDRAAPARVAGDRAFESLSTGQHACAIADDGDLYCWGPNSEGQLGTGDRDDMLEPTRVATTERFAAVTTGGSHSCAVTPGGALFCWGGNDTGQLGDGGLSLGWTTPVAVWRW